MRRAFAGTGRVRRGWEKRGRGEQMVVPGQATEPGSPAGAYGVEIEGGKPDGGGSGAGYLLAAKGSSSSTMRKQATWRGHTVIGGRPRSSSPRDVRMRLKVVESRIHVKGSDKDALPVTSAAFTNG